MTMTPLGDLAQSLLLRRSVSATQTTVSHALRDLSAGQAADPAAHLKGHTSPLTAIDSTLSRNRALGQALQLAGTRAEVMQTALSQIDATAAEAARALISASQTANPATLRLASDLAEDALRSTVSALNQRAMGQSVFAGTATDRPAIAPVADILTAARVALSGALSSADASQQLDDWFADPGGFASLITASPDPVTVPLSPEATVALPVTAHDPLLQGTLKGLILGSLLSDPAFASSTPAMKDLAATAADRLHAAAEPRAELAARLGLAQSRIEQASTRLAAEDSALGIARNDLLAIDSFETATRLTEAESRLEQLYAITARLARLSLAEYMR